MAISVSGGVVAYSIGGALYSVATMLSLDAIRVATTVIFLMLVLQFIQETSTRTERLNINQLLTTVPAREVVLGVVFFVYGWAVVRFSLPTLSIAVGFALGTRSLTRIPSIIVAVAGLLALAVLIGVSLSFLVEFVTTRSARFQRYKMRIVMAAFVIIISGWLTVGMSIAGDSLLGFLGTIPSGWFVDLGLLGLSGVQSDPLRAMCTLGLLGGGLPVVTIVTTVLAKRVWETEPVSATTSHRSQSLVGEGLTERVFAGYVSRPVLTVARKRWLQERRVPRGLLIAGYMLLVLPVVYLPILAAGEILAISPILLALIFAVGTGLAFGKEVLGTEYPTLSMTLTSVPGRQFIRGTVLAGVTIGAPPTIATTAVFAWGSPIGSIETILVTIVSVVLCVCSVTLATAIGMSIPYREFWPTPIPFFGGTAYTGEGTGFVKIGTLLALVGLASLPALIGYLPIFYGSIAMILDTSTVVVRVGSLFVTTAIAVVTSVAAYRRAVTLFDQYETP